MKPAKLAVKFWMVCCVLALGTLVVWLSPYLLGAEVDKAPAPLAHELKLLSRELGINPRFAALGLDDVMPDEEVAGLGTRDYLLRDYTKLTPDKKPSNDAVALNINYYAKGTATPHVPDICWLGNGLVKVYDTPIIVHDVPHKDGTKTDVPMRLLSFVPRQSGNVVMPGLEQQTDQEHLITVAYTFQVNGQYVGNRAQVAKMFWRRDSKYCYHCKIEIKYKTLCTPEKARPVIEEFLRASLPHIEECLPDWQKLNSPAGLATASAGSSAGH